MTSFEKSVLPPHVSSALCSSSVVIFPTETLYGIGCNIWCEDAVARVFEIKGRTPDQPPPVLIHEIEQLRFLAEQISLPAQLLMKQFWPGSLTLILPAKDALPKALCALDKNQNARTIAVRRTAHPFAAALSAALNAPLVATSANFSGAAGRAAQPQALDEIPVAFQKLADVVIDGGAVGGAPSTIVDCVCSPPRLVRAGAVALSELRKILPKIQES